MFCVKVHVFNQNFYQVHKSCVSHGKSCSAGAAASEENIHICIVLSLWLRNYFSCLTTQSKFKKRLWKTKCLCFPCLPCEFELLEEESTSREYRQELQKLGCHGPREGRRKKRWGSNSKWNGKSSFCKLKLRILQKICRVNPIACCTSWLSFDYMKNI